MSRKSVGLFFALTLATTATAEPFIARESAHVGQKGDYSVGVFAPLTLAVADQIELRTHPILFFVSPNLDVRISHWQQHGWYFTSETGFSLPTPALRLAQGYLFPTWADSDKRVGWILVPHVGAIVSHGEIDATVLSLSADITVGFPLSRNDATPLSAPAPLEVEFAPALARYRARVGALYDFRISDRWRLRGYADTFLIRADPSPFVFRAGGNIDLRIGKTSRIAFGAIWWNSNQHAINERTMQPVRSNDFLPTLDFVWNSGNP